MPIYAYRCNACDGRHEALQKVGATPLVTCPHCHQDTLRKVIAPVGIVFKGSGFHVNDYNGRSSSKANGTAKSDTSAKTDATAKTNGTASKDTSSKGSSSDSGSSCSGGTCACSGD